MPYDGLVLAAVKKELEEKITGGRIDRIYQPEKDQLILVIHRPGERMRLLLSAGARDARAHLLAGTKENPAAPPLFCMVLRKHLEGGRITGLEQPGLERVLTVKVETRDELGQPAEKHLICEIMGKHSNIILVEPADGSIVDAIKRYSHTVSRHREVLPGRPYVPPPRQEKLNPLELKEEEFWSSCLEAPLTTPLPELLQKKFSGLSTVTCREIVFRAGLDPDTILDQCGEYELVSLWKSLKRIAESFARGEFEPCLTYTKKGEVVDFSSLALTHTGLFIKRGSMNQILDEFYAARELAEKIEREKNLLLTLVSKEISRLEKKLDLYTKSMQETEEMEKWRLFGELLTANMYRLKRGMSSVTVENYYEKDCPPVTVPLDPMLTPQENAQLFFKKYNKAKNTRQALESRISSALEELEYLETVKTYAELASTAEELDEIALELARGGYNTGRQDAVISRTGRKKVKTVPFPLAFLSSEGFTILVGRNNTQNDYLTAKMAADTDIWLHARGLPGAHVIIRTGGREVPPLTLKEAATLAAYYSKGRSAKNVLVDYTLKKHVRKPKGARTGMVVYEQEKTITVVPDEELVDSMKKT